MSENEEIKKAEELGEKELAEVAGGVPTSAVPVTNRGLATQAETNRGLTSQEVARRALDESA
jgi:hypothetical protein